jgi:hypothetical protein
VGRVRFALGLSLLGAEVAAFRFFHPVGAGAFEDGDSGDFGPTPLDKDRLNGFLGT